VARVGWCVLLWYDVLLWYGVVLYRYDVTFWKVLFESWLVLCCACGVVLMLCAVVV